MSSAIATSQNRAIVDSVLAIMNTMFTYLTDSSNKKLTRAYLTTLGFGGLPDYESFGVRHHDITLIRLPATDLDHCSRSCWCVIARAW